MTARNEDSLPSFLLVDGQNIIHAWPELKKLLKRDAFAAQQELIRILSEYHSFSGTKVVIVFDGRGNQINEERSSEGVQIFFTSSGKTADDVIERLAIKYASTYQITVATNDIMEQDAVVAAGGNAISAEMLSNWIDRNQAEIRRLF